MDMVWVCTIPITNCVNIAPHLVFQIYQN